MYARAQILIMVFVDVHLEIVPLVGIKDGHAQVQPKVLLVPMELLQQIQAEYIIATP